MTTNPSKPTSLNSPKTIERIKKKATAHLTKRLEESAAAHKESVAKWEKDHPLREPGTSLKTWKSYSGQRIGSEEYRDGWERVFGKKKYK